MQLLVVTQGRILYTQGPTRITDRSPQSRLQSDLPGPVISQTDATSTLEYT